MAAIAKGEAVISINPQETEAKLIFTPKPDGLGWDISAINKLAQESRLSPPPDTSILEPFLSRAGRTKSKEPMEIILYQGVPPEDPVPETITWEDLPVPEDLADFQEEARSVTPEVYRVKVERIKIEKTVKKHGALPFMAQKEETVVSWDRKETREIVEVNPEIRELKYSGEEQKIGTLKPPLPGKPGKSVFGRPIPPPRIETESIFLGTGILREGNNLITRGPGFIRIGENWVDLVPLAKPVWDIIIGLDGLTPFFSFKPGDPRFPPPSSEEVLRMAIEKGAEEKALVSPASLDEEIAEAVNTNTELHSFPLIESREAKAEVKINEDKTKAVLYLRKGTAGYPPLNMKAISQALKNSAVRITDFEKLKADIQIFMSGKDLELKDYVLAEGTASTRGKDRELTLLVPLLSQEEQEEFKEKLKPYFDRLHKRGLPLDELTGLAFVEKETEVARVEASSEGEAGKDVFGNIINGIPGNDPDLKLLDGLKQHGEFIISDRSGLLLIKASGRSFSAELIDYVDAKMEIRISPDIMEARCDLFKESGAGIPLSPDWVVKELEAQGIVKGIDLKEIETACSLAGARGSCLDAPLARGTVPVAKGGRTVKWLVNVSPPQLAGMDNTGEMPGQTVQVKSGTAIVEMSAVEETGRSGYNISGDEITPDHGAVTEIEYDDSIWEEAVEGGGKRLLAARGGELSFDGTALSISSLREISGDVGPETGNIKFAGRLEINGNVLPGFSVIAGQQLRVTGTATEALTSSGGNAIIEGGIKGGGKGVVRAGKIEAAFSEKASITALGDISLDIGSASCIIKTNGRLSIKSDKGKFLGGVCQARNGIDVAEAGSKTGVRTEISFGQDYFIKNQIQNAREEIDKVKTALTEIEKTISRELKNPEALNQVRNEKVRLIKNMEQLRRKVFDLEEKFEVHHESEVKIRGTVFSGVVLESHGRYFEIKQARKGVVFYFDRESGRIKEKALTGN